MLFLIITAKPLQNLTSAKAQALTTAKEQRNMALPPLQLPNPAQMLLLVEQ